MKQQKTKPTMMMPPGQAVTSKINLDDPALVAMIDSGGGTVSEKKKKTVEKSPVNDELKNFSIRIFQSELDDIKRHLSGLSGRKTKSIHTFILEAINEKLVRENRKA